MTDPVHSSIREPGPPIEDPFEIRSWFGQVVWHELFLAAAERAGVRSILGAAQESDERLWAACDVGLADCQFEVHEGAPIGCTIQVCPWIDVKNPEVTARSVVAQGIHVTVELVIQLPRCRVTASNTARMPAFAGLARAVLERAGP